MSAAFNIGDKVLDKFNKIPGTIRENRKNFDGSYRYKVEFSPQDQKFLNEDDLELINQDSILDMFGKGTFLDLDVLKRILTYTRLKGDITNIFYSMNNHATEFFAHQFAPVIKFIESTVGRILIADEVGLGKTIEAMYIWEELVARENSQRLLIVCPSVLREKWAHDLDKFFSISAEIVNAPELLNYAKETEARPLQKNFALITSLEGIRYKEKFINGKLIADQSPKAKLNDFLDSRTASSLEQIFDLVVVDEAHYLRNSETASYKTVSKLRDNSKNLVLLSATPIQTSEVNLYNLLNILDPDVFYDKYAFEVLLNKSQNYVKIANALGQPNIDISSIGVPIANLINQSFNDQNLITQFCKDIDLIKSNPEKRIEYQKLFHKKVFYSNYFTRTRRREAFEDHAQRVAETWAFPLSNYEKDIYDRISHILQKETIGQSLFNQFQIIARQRQMTSCMPAAFSEWENKSFSEELQDMLYEDLDMDMEDYNSNELFDTDDFLKKKNISIDIKKLRSQDSKFNKLVTEIRKKFSENPSAKIVIFSFYRGTVKYLTERFMEENIKCINLMGGQGISKQDVIDNFKSDASIRVLISTEVGSEGIDLQFCDTEINYDLPWNPMRLEQRIGRIDRIGQKAKVLHIINMVCQNTVEDRVLERLYNRINIFKDSIGDIEEILGKQIQDIALSLMNSDIDDATREKIAYDKVDALINKKMQMEDLEEKAPSSIAFKDFIVNNINEAKTAQRYIHVNDLIFYVTDYLEKNWPGSVVANHSKYDGAKIITLSQDANIAFGKYSRAHGYDSFLEHAPGSILCLFDASLKTSIRSKTYDVITPIHPLIKWINEENANKSIKNMGCCSITLKLPADEKIDRGMYTFYMMEQIAEGYISKKEIKYYLTNIQTGEVIDCKKSEAIMMHIFDEDYAKFSASTNANWENDINYDLQRAADMLNASIDQGFTDITQFEENYKKENEELCNNQLEYLKVTTEQRIKSLNQAIENMKLAGGREIGIKLFESKIAMAEKNKEYQERKIRDKMRARCSSDDVAIGLLKIE